jgi:hypothetical protein
MVERSEGRKGGIEDGRKEQKEKGTKEGEYE